MGEFNRKQGSSIQSNSSITSRSSGYSSSGASTLEESSYSSKTYHPDPQFLAQPEAKISTAQSPKKQLPQPQQHQEPAKPKIQPQPQFQEPQYQQSSSPQTKPKIQPQPQMHQAQQRKSGSLEDEHNYRESQPHPERVQSIDRGQHSDQSTQIDPLQYKAIMETNLALKSELQRLSVFELKCKSLEKEVIDCLVPKKLFYFEI